MQFKFTLIYPLWYLFHIGTLRCLSLIVDLKTETLKIYSFLTIIINIFFFINTTALNLSMHYNYFCLCCFFISLFTTAAKMRWKLHSIDTQSMK